MCTDGVWLYAVTAGLPESRLTGVTGVDAERLRTVEQGELVAVVGPVDLESFGEEPLHRKLDDLTSLEAMARAHHAVVDAVARLATLVPIRLATVCRDSAAVAALLEERQDDFTAALFRIAGRDEWGVKAYAPHNRPTESEAEPPSGSKPAGPGTSYLLRRKAQQATVQNARQEAADIVDRCHTELSRLTVASRRRPPQGSQLTGSSGWMVLNGAYLVDQARAGEFAEAVEALKGVRPEVRLELTGPWPPYSFTAVETAESEGASEGTESRT